jgi:hypothetical protein
MADTPPCLTNSNPLLNHLIFRNHQDIRHSDDRKKKNCYCCHKPYPDAPLSSFFRIPLAEIFSSALQVTVIDDKNSPVPEPAVATNDIEGAEQKLSSQADEKEDVSNDEQASNSTHESDKSGEDESDDEDDDLARLAGFGGGFLRKQVSLMLSSEGQSSDDEQSGGAEDTKHEPEHEFLVLLHADYDFLYRVTGESPGKWICEYVEELTSEDVYHGYFDQKDMPARIRAVLNLRSNPIVRVKKKLRGKNWEWASDERLQQSTKWQRELESGMSAELLFPPHMQAHDPTHPSNQLQELPHYILPVTHSLASNIPSVVHLQWNWKRMYGEYILVVAQHKSVQNHLIQDYIAYVDEASKQAESPNSKTGNASTDEKDPDSKTNSLRDRDGAIAHPIPMLNATFHAGCDTCNEPMDLYKTDLAGVTCRKCGKGYCIWKCRKCRVFFCDPCALSEKTFEQEVRVDGLELSDYDVVLYNSVTGNSMRHRIPLDHRTRWEVHFRDKTAYAKFLGRIDTYLYTVIFETVEEDSLDYCCGYTIRRVCLDTLLWDDTYQLEGKLRSEFIHNSSNIADLVSASVFAGPATDLFPENTLFDSEIRPLQI